MSTSTQYQVYRRTFALALILLSVIGVAVGRLARLQLRPPSRDPPTAFFPAVRGNIYDRHGYLLAVATTVYDIGASPRHVVDAQALADRLAPVLAEPRDKLLALLTDSKPYVLLKRGVSADIAKKIMSWELGGLQADARPGRVYPHGSLAACVLGFVNDDGEAVCGVEEHYDQALAGAPGFRLPARDAVGSLFYQFNAPQGGVDLFLTLDINIQHMVEGALARAVTRTAAKKGVAIVIEPASGAILAMAVFPSYDLNTREVADPGWFANAAISEQYEPGSVFKVVTIAAALDAGVISPNSTYYDGGKIIVGDREIKNSDGVAHGQTTIADLLAYSLNVGAANTSTQLGAFEFYDYTRRFGFGALSGVDLAYEIAGHVRFPGDREWHESDLGTNSFGQGLAVTPLQMLAAISAIANHGVLMRPHIVDQMVAGEKVTKVTPQVVRQAVSAETAAEVTQLLVYAVNNVLTTAAIPGYTVAGKSGTSQVPVAGGYDPEETIASFAGYAPADDPQFAILVAVHHPQKEHWGLRAAAPVFQEIAEQLLNLLGVPPDSARASMQRQ